MMEYGKKVTPDLSTFDDPQYMSLKERLQALPLQNLGPPWNM